jgi:DinB superfamily
MHEVQALLREYDRARAYTDELWKDLSPEEVTWRPHENSSAIGWHLGHQQRSPGWRYLVLHPS